MPPNIPWVSNGSWDCIIFQVILIKAQVLTSLILKGKRCVEAHTMWMVPFTDKVITFSYGNNSQWIWSIWMRYTYIYCERKYVLVTCDSSSSFPAKNTTGISIQLITNHYHKSWIYSGRWLWSRKGALREAYLYTDQRTHTIIVDIIVYFRSTGPLYGCHKSHTTQWNY